MNDVNEQVFATPVAGGTKTSPILYVSCGNCPFSRRGQPVIVNDERLVEFATSLLRGDSFPCHKTVDYSDEDCWDDSPPTGNLIHCAGAAMLLLNMGRKNTIMQVAGRLGMYDPTKHTAEERNAAFNSIDELRQWHLDHGGDIRQPGDPRVDAEAEAGLDRAMRLP